MERRWIAAIGLFLAAFALYVHGAYPSVSAGDSGEFIAASHTLGIPHAPGFPAYVVLAKSAQRAIPWGNIGYRSNLFSAVCGALAVLLLYFLTLHLSETPVLAACAAGVFMLSAAHRVNAQASEVFALNALFCAAVLWAAFSDRWLLAALFMGWGLGNHQTILFLLPALGVAYLAKPTGERAPVPPIILSALTGLSVYAFLYVRAGGSPALNGGNPDTLERLWRVLTRADYGTLTLALGDAPERTWVSTGRQLWRFTQGLSDQVTWFGVLAGAVGIAVGLRKRSAPAVILAIAFLCIGPGFFVLGNLPFDPQSTGVLERFYIVPTLCWTLLAALGVQFVFQSRPWAAAAALLLPVALLSAQAGAAGFRGDFRAYAYGRNNLCTLPPRALFLMDGGDDTFYTLAYLRWVENRRPDVRLHDRGGVVYPGFYGTDFRQLTRDEKESRRQQVERAALASGQALYYSTMNEKILPDVKLAQEGILYRAAPHARAGPGLWDLYDLRGVAPWNASSLKIVRDYRTRALLPFYPYQRSVQAAGAMDWESAIGFAAAAHAAGPDVVWLIPNLVLHGHLWAQTHFQAGRFDAAERIYRGVTRWDPASSSAWSNLGAIEERRQRLDSAIALYQKAIALDPSSEAAHYNLAVAYWKQSDWPRVIETFSRVLALNPNNTAARNYLTQARARAGR